MISYSRQTKKEYSPKEFNRRFAFEIAVELTDSELRTNHSTPNDTVEFLPRIAKIIAVKINH